MKKFILAALALAALTTAYAQDKANNFTLALETSSYTYKEPSGPRPVKMSGQMYGASAAYMYGGMGKNESSFISLDLLYMQGRVDYDGWMTNIVTGDSFKAQESGIGNYFVEGRLKFGSAFKPSDKLELSPYLGLGGRYLVNNFGAKPGGYDRTSLYLYIPLGLNADLRLPRGWGLGFNAEYNWLLTGKQKSQMSDINPAWNNLSNTQNHGYGIRLSARVKKDLKRIGIFAEPFFRYWNIQESEESVLNIPGEGAFLMVEPKNNTTECGLKAGIYF